MKIVIGYDGSEAARRALDRVAELAGGGKVSVVSAVHVLPQFGRAPLTIDPEEIAERKSELKEAAEFLSAKGIKPSLVEGHGEPADVIVEKAQELGADLIVVGTSGQNTAKRVLLGSVSTSVLHKAHCDVLVGALSIAKAVRNRVSEQQHGDRVTRAAAARSNSLGRAR